MDADLPAPVRQQVQDAVTALRELARVAATADRRVGLDGHLPCAQHALGRLVPVLADVTELGPAEELPESVLVHRYFGVRRARWSDRPIALHALVMIDRALLDVGLAAVDGNDVAAEAEAMVEIVAAIGRGSTGVDAAPTHLAAPDGSARSTVLGYRPDGSSLDRWIVSHHLYFLFNVHAAARIHAAIDCVRVAALRSAARHLRVAATLVRGFTGAMAHSSTVSREHYRDVVRPTMSPPAAPVGLTGSMQPEHRAFRRSVEMLLATLDQDQRQLAALSPELAIAREMVLEADLVDLERHVCVADMLVREEPSLAQRHDESSAVSVLRRMRDERSDRYTRLMSPVPSLSPAAG